ncbi:hypothetical protein [Nonomuraea maritima]|uniref:hypothetical protein n=1 Tax=Nonomuraea maritima TaxID=683260 RepID=UPI00371CB4D6
MLDKQAFPAQVEDTIPVRFRPAPATRSRQQAPKAAADERAMELLERVGIAAQADKCPAQLPDSL